MILECGNYEIIFDLEPGVYTDSESNSATGKTYTTKMLKGLIAAGNKNILVLSYDTVSSGGIEKYINIIESNNFDIIFVDRASLYITSELYSALENSGAIVYLDIKENESLDSHYGKECSIEFIKGRIRYYVDSF